VENPLSAVQRQPIDTRQGASATTTSKTPVCDGERDCARPIYTHANARSPLRRPLGSLLLRRPPPRRRLRVGVVVTATCSVRRRRRVAGRTGEQRRHPSDAQQVGHEAPLLRRRRPG